MSRDIFNSVEATDPSHIVRFRTAGRGAPLFCFPGSGGNPYIFREMVAALPEGQPAFALDMEWLCDAQQDFTVEQIAEFCLDVVRTIQASGPYYFCGYSFGGLVAYETAQRLVRTGENVNLVALLDAPNPALTSNLSATEAVQFHKTYLMDRLKIYGRHLVRGDIRAFMGRGLAFVVSRAGESILPPIKIGFRMMNRPMPAALRANDSAFVKAYNSYRPKPYPKGLACIRVQERGQEHDQDPSMGWNACALGGVHVHVVPGGHVNMMKMPSVKIIAETLAKYLDHEAIQKGLIA